MMRVLSVVLVIGLGAGCSHGGGQGPAAATPVSEPAATVSPAASEPAAAATPASELPEQNVQPGANERFLNPELDVQRWQQRFEGESREIYARREAISAALDLRPGMAVADVGAGTGLFMSMFSASVGTEGKVFAVEISPRFLEHLAKRSTAEGLSQVTVVAGTERSVELPENSVDLVFVCDTYHHFEYPKSTLASIARALRPGGVLVIIDFVRIPGSSRAWVMEHVRGGQQEFISEITAAGFELERQEQVPGLQENYMLRFRLTPR